MTGRESGTTEVAAAPSGHRIRRTRGLPGSRAVVGALLVSASAVGVFATYLTATSEPDTRYAVAAVDVEVGTRLDSDATVAELFELVPIELPDDVVPRAVNDRQVSQLTGQLTTSPIRQGDLLLASAIVDDARVPRTEKLSFSLPAADAVGGSLQPGERIDVLATYGSGADAWTAFVVRGALLVDHSSAQEGVASRGEVTLTIAVSSLTDVQAVGHAIRTGEVLVTRSTVAEGSDEPAPEAFAPSRDAPGPRPDPAVGMLGGVGRSAPVPAESEQEPDGRQPEEPADEARSEG